MRDGRGGDDYHVTTLANEPSRVIPGSRCDGLYDKNMTAVLAVTAIQRCSRISRCKCGRT